MIIRTFSILLALAVAAPVIGQPTNSYGDTLIDGIMARHRDLAFVQIDATVRDGTPIVLRRGPTAPNTIRMPLANSMGEPIGAITVRFTHKRHEAAAMIAIDAARRIYVADNLIEADPFVAGAHRSALAQRIVDRTMADNPDLVTLGLHVGASGADNAILASSFGRIGKPGDKDDARVIHAGVILKEPTNGGNRLAVSLPLHDRQRHVIGALSTSFLVGLGGVDAAVARASVVRDEIARQLPSLAAVTR